MRLYIIAGEASGDLHGGNLIRAIKSESPQTEIHAWGGEKMQAAGAVLRKHYRELAFMGFIEVVANLRTILRNFEVCKKDILKFKPDALVLIDYPGFNLRMAAWAKKQGIRVVYYISPQIWAWHQSRVHKIRETVDKMLVILPFEQDFYKKHGMSVSFVGHPLMDELPEKRPDLSQKKGKAPIALLPGSRKQEVSKILPVMLETAKLFPDREFIIAASTALPVDYYAGFVKNMPNVRLVQGETYQILQSSEAALVKSGTSTLETALLGTPQVVCYKGSTISFAIAKRVVNIKYIALVNLILDRSLVPELIQGDLNPAALQKELTALLDDGPAAQKQKLGYQELREKLGGKGASLRAARIILGLA